MSAEQGDRKPELREIMSGAVRTVSEQSSELMQTVVQVLKDGEQVDVASLTAAFDLNANLNRTLKEFLENQGRVVFPEGQSVQPAAIDDRKDEERNKPSLPEGPKTFGELLKAKIDNELLPANNGSFTKSEIFEAAKNKKAVKKAASAEGFASRKVRFTRQEAINILYRVFITPAGAFKKKREFFSLQEIRTSFFPTNRDLLNQLSGEVNYDWLQNPTIDYQTAMELRGLGHLEKILTGEKVTRKGRTGAQFTKRPDSLSNQHIDSHLTSSEAP